MRERERREEWEGSSRVLCDVLHLLPRAISLCVVSMNLPKLR